MSEWILKEEERVAFSLRALYEKYGYLPYKMSKFEEYDLYMRNKEVLVGDGVITFNDTDGKLLALKPDVTLSIIKNHADEQGKRKVYYHESVYRVSEQTKQFKEVTQVGLECLGEIDLYDTYETVCLALKSLSLVSQNFVVDISHLGLLTAVLENLSVGAEFTEKVKTSLYRKNAQGLVSLCEEYGVGEEIKSALQVLVNAYGESEKVLKMLQPVAEKYAKEEYARLQALCGLLAQTEYADKIRLDFSVENSRNYYNDVVFKGYVEGISESVLSGGRYDKLTQRMGKQSGAIGFAVYLDLLEDLKQNQRKTDVDILLLYDEKTSKTELVQKAEALIKDGNSVRVQKTADGVRYEKLVDMRGGAICVC